MNIKFYTLFWLLVLFSISLAYFNETNFIMDAMGMSIVTNNSPPKTPIDHVIVISQGKRSLIIILEHFLVQMELQIILKLDMVHFLQD